MSTGRPRIICDYLAGDDRPASPAASTKTAMFDPDFGSIIDLVLT